MLLAKFFQKDPASNKRQTAPKISALQYFHCKIGTKKVPDIRIKVLGLKCKNVKLGGYYVKTVSTVMMTYYYFFFLNQS